MKLKEKIKEEPGFQYVVDSLELMSSVGRRRLLEQEWLTTPDDIEEELSRTAVASLVADGSQRFATVRHQLMQLHDISGTLRNLQCQVLINEIEMLEIKRFCQLCTIAHKALHEPLLLTISDQLETIFSLLDPDHTGMAHFYLYDSYDPRLAPLRKALKASPEDPTLFARMQEVEQQVLTRLNDRLAPYAAVLMQALEAMAYLDLVLAKGEMTRRWHLQRPTPGGTQLRCHGLWNPRLKARCEEQGLRYQPVDIELAQGTTLITGANMSGKTVLLKTLGIAQMMMQFGFMVPALDACLPIVDDVLLCIGDEQNEMNGLSSFASEILKISDAIARTSRQRLLILIDEPARTTNPIEGKAIVQSLSTLLHKESSFTLVTTHYSHLGLPCRKLRVKGFDEKLSSQPLNPQNINLFMDYSLLPDDSDEAPHEALRIASILGCHPALLASAAHFLDE